MDSAVDRLSYLKNASSFPKLNDCLAVNDCLALNDRVVEEGNFQLEVDRGRVFAREGGAKLCLVSKNELTRNNYYLKGFMFDVSDFKYLPPHSDQEVLSGVCREEIPIFHFYSAHFKSPTGENIPAGWVHISKYWSGEKHEIEKYTDHSVEFLLAHFDIPLSNNKDTDYKVQLKRLVPRIVQPYTDSEKEGYYDKEASITFPGSENVPVFIPTSIYVCQAEECDDNHIISKIDLEHTWLKYCFIFQESTISLYHCNWIKDFLLASGNNLLIVNYPFFKLSFMIEDENEFTCSCCVL
jgi:hypothetical protein